jgi:hypothetical protein
MPLLLVASCTAPTGAACCRCVLTSAQLIAEKIDRTGFAAGFDWCAEQLRAGNHHHMANEVDLAKASRHLECQEFAAAIAVFKVAPHLPTGCNTPYPTPSLKCCTALRLGCRR